MAFLLHGASDSVVYAYDYVVNHVQPLPCIRGHGNNPFLVLFCRLPYRDLCLQLPEAKFRQFLCKTLEVLFDLMCSYYTMMTWHQQPEVRCYTPN